MGRATTQKERWVKDIKIVMSVGEELTAKDIANRISLFDWSTHQKNLNRGARSGALHPTQMQVIGVLKSNADFLKIVVSSKRTTWRRLA